MFQAKVEAAQKLRQEKTGKSRGEQRGQRRQPTTGSALWQARMNKQTCPDQDNGQRTARSHGNETRIHLGEDQPVPEPAGERQQRNTAG